MPHSSNPMINLSKRQSDRSWWALAIVLFTALAVWPWLGLGADTASIRDVLILALFAVGLDLFWGRSGILSFGHAAFFGLGAYGMAITTVTFGWSAWAGLLAGVLLAAGVALLLAYFLLGGGVRGEYFTVVTLTTSLIAQQIAVGWSAVTGGDSGMVGVPSLSLGGIAISNTWVQLYAVLAILVIVTFALRAAFSGATGRLFLAIESAETKAQTLGYATAGHLIGLFASSALIAGFAGALYVSLTGFVTPDLIGLVLSTEVILWVATGGRGGFLGAILGTIIVWQFQRWVSSVNQTLWPLFMGMFFVILIFALPQGVEPLLRKVSCLFNRRDISSSAASSERDAR